jgi:hypothetical protein
MHGRYITGSEPARYSGTLSAFRRGQGPQVGSSSRIVQEADMICQIGGEGRCAMSFDVARRRHNRPSGEADASCQQGSIRDLPLMHGEIRSVINHVAEAIAHHEFDLQVRVIGEQQGKPRC